MLPIALIDAATNCARDGAVAILTIKGGVQITGFLEKPIGSLYVEGATVHIRPSGSGDAWATVLVSEIAAVEARR
jgi:hypothetical protein